MRHVGRARFAVSTFENSHDHDHVVDDLNRESDDAVRINLVNVSRGHAYSSFCDISTFKDIIIHAGTNDISKNISLDESVASMEATITLIMLKPPTASIHISSVCPRTKDNVQHKIDTLNHALQELAKRLRYVVLS